MREVSCKPGFPAGDPSRGSGNENRPPGLVPGDPGRGSGNGCFTCFIPCIWPPGGSRLGLINFDTNGTFGMITVRETLAST